MSFRSQYRSPLPVVSRWRVMALAAMAVLALFLLLVLSQWLASFRTVEIVELRSLEVVSAELPPPPEPPREALEEPAPAPRMTPPRLELEIAPLTPSLPALRSEPLNFEIDATPFPTERPPLDIVPVAPAPPRRAEPRIAARTPKPAAPPRAPAPKPTAPEPPPKKTVYQAGELDAKPRLRNRPRASFPSSLARQGVSQGEVVLYVEISADGHVRILDVLRASHPDLTTMARQVARQARFTRPTKDGRPVKALFRWPLVLKN